MIRNLHRALLYGTLTLLVLQCRGASAGILDGTFKLDGAATNNTAVAGDDWDSLFPVHQPSATALTAVFIADSKTDACGDLTEFSTGGSKDNLDISNWRFTCGKSQDKDEITDAYAALYQQGSNLFLVFGADRYDNSGAATIGFWFFQNPVDIITTGPNAGKFSSMHAVGDLLVVSDFTSGGSSSTNRVFKWVGGTNPLSNITVGADCSVTPVGGVACTIVNSGTTPSPWPYTPKAGSANSFPAGTFFEGAINISLLVPGEECFASFMAETRSSSAVNASLADFAIGRLGTCCLDVTKTADKTLVCPSTPVTYTYVANNCGAFALNNVTLVDDNGTPGNTSDDVSMSIPALNYGGSFSTNLTFTLTGPGPLTNIVTATAMRGAMTVTATDSAVVTVGAPPPCSITGTNVITCQGQSAEFCATNLVGTSYSWAGPAGFVANTRCTGPISTPGVYVVMITDSSGCQRSCSRLLSVNQPVACSITPASATVCQGQTAQFCATNLVGASYSWTGPGGFTANTRCITVGAAGTYTVVITGSNGCMASCSATLTVNALPACSITGNNALCAGQNTEFCGPAGMASYSWSGPGGFTANTQCTGPIGTAGQYDLQVVSDTGCTNSCSRTLTVGSQLPCSILAEFCATNVLGATYSWSGPGGFATNTPCTGPVSATGTYSVVIMDVNGCTNSCRRTLGE